MSADTSLPSIVAEIEWMTGALQAGFAAGKPADGELLDCLVEHLRNVKRLAELLEDELAVSRNLVADLNERARAVTARLHPQPEKMQ